jgi:hypothetical protein
MVNFGSDFFNSHRRNLMDAFERGTHYRNRQNMDLHEISPLLDELASRKHESNDHFINLSDDDDDDDEYEENNHLKEDLIPCEFCQKPFKMSLLFDHQVLLTVSLYVYDTLRF